MILSFFLIYNFCDAKQVSDTLWLLDVTASVAKASPNGKIIAHTNSISDPKVLQVRNSLNSSIIWEKNTETIRDLTFSHDGKYIISSHDDLKIRFWNAENGNLEKVYLSNYSNPNKYTSTISIECSQDGKYIAQSLTGVNAGFPFYGIIILKASDGSIIKEFSKTEDEIRKIKFTNDSKYFVYPASNDIVFKYSVKVCSVSDFSIVSEFTNFQSQIFDLALSPDSKMFGIVNGEGVHVWNITSKENVLFTNAPSILWTIAFTKDSKFVIAGLENYVDSKKPGVTDFIEISKLSFAYEYPIKSFYNVEELDLFGAIMINSGTQIALLKNKWNPNPPAPKISSDAQNNSLEFGCIDINKEIIKTISFKNEGTAYLIIDTIELKQKDTLISIKNSMVFPICLAVNETLSLDIAYKDSQYNHQYEGALVCKSNEANKDSLVIQLKGSTKDVNIVDDERKLLSEELNIYPSPAEDFIYINGSDNYNSFKIFSITGQLIEEYQNYVIDVSSLQSGVYFVKQGSAVRKFVKI